MRRLAVLLAVLLAAVLASSAAAVDPFYAGLLRDGTHAFDRGDAAAAARDLRIACFGYLDEPPGLAECLVRLAAAQAATGDERGFADTFRRLAEVEERFGGYAKAEVPPAVLAAFEARAVAAIPEPTLRSVPAFVPLAERKKAAAGQAGGAPARRGAAAPPAAPAVPPAPSTAPGAGPVAGTNGDAGAPAPPAATVPAMAAEPTEAEPSAAEREQLEAARRLMGAGATSADLKQALALAREVADRHPRHQEAQHLAAEAAYRTSRWGDAAAYFQRGGDPGDGRPELLFYLAVALWETGDQAGARRIIARALPNLQKTPYVEAYGKKILGR